MRHLDAEYEKREVWAGRCFISTIESFETSASSLIEEMGNYWTTLQTHSQSPNFIWYGGQGHRLSRFGIQWHLTLSFDREPQNISIQEAGANGHIPWSVSFAHFRTLVYNFSKLVFALVLGGESRGSIYSGRNLPIRNPDWEDALNESWDISPLRPNAARRSAI